MQYRIIQIFLILNISVGLLLFFNFGIGSSWYFFLAAGLLVLLFVFMGTVSPALRELHRGNPERAEKLINQIRRPDWLLRPYRAMYFYIKGIIELHRKNLDQGKNYLDKALQLGIKDARIHAICLLNLAHISFAQEKFDETQSYIKAINKLEVNDLKIKDGVKELQGALSSRLS